MKIRLCPVIGTLALAAVMPAAAEPINPATVPQVAPMNAQEKQNFDFVTEYLRTIIVAHHVDLAPQYVAENNIEHNPNRDSGIAAYIEHFGRQAPIPIPESLEHGPVVIGAKGDLVWFIHEDEATDPRDPSKTYLYNSFDMERIADGKIQEHWDAARRAPQPAGAPALPYFVQHPSSFGNTGTRSAEEQRNVDIATVMSRDVMHFGHVELADELLDPDYIEHNPNAPQGREAFVQYLRNRAVSQPRAPIEADWELPAVMLASGPYVFMMWERTAHDPTDPSREYTWSHFNLLRIEDGLIKEHWSDARIAAPTE